MNLWTLSPRISSKNAVTTKPRTFGYVFNPISFWLCQKNGNLDAVLCEVSNTFGEHHFFWIAQVTTCWISVVAAADFFDKIISVEMLEAVGEDYCPTYFKKLRQLLKPKGKISLQTSSIKEKFFADYRTQPDFLQQYIFPGYILPTRTIVVEQAREAGLEASEPFVFSSSILKPFKPGAKTLFAPSKIFEPWALMRNLFSRQHKIKLKPLVF